MQVRVFMDAGDQFGAEFFAEHRNPCTSLISAPKSLKILRRWTGEGGQCRCYSGISPLVLLKFIVVSAFDDTNTVFLIIIF